MSEEQTSESAIDEIGTSAAMETRESEDNPQIEETVRQENDVQLQVQETVSQENITHDSSEVAPPSSNSSSRIAFKVPTLIKVKPKSKTFSSPNSPKPRTAAFSASVNSTDTQKDNESTQEPTILCKNAVKKEPEEASINLDSAPKPVKLKMVAASPAEQLKQSQIQLPYKEPSWGGHCPVQYNFEVLKNGAIIDNVDLTTKSYHVIGRLPSCDVTLEHPSLSRYHAVVQYCPIAAEKQEVGWYLYDLDSTHGTWINKIKVKPKVYYRIRVGHVIKFGGSTRLFITQGPEEDVEEESELTVTEIKEQRDKQKMELELQRQKQEMEAEERQLKAEQEAQDKGCSWGIFEEDAADEENEGENPFALPELQNEDLYIDDPKKALKSYFEREGLDLPEYEFEEVGFGQHKCSVELPIDDGNTGKPIRVEVQVSGKKKEAVIQCALEACRALDRYGELRKANQESRKRKSKNWEEQDFYDSDEDTYLDRTGEIERKREKRMKKAGKLAEKADTYDTLVEKLKEVQNHIHSIEDDLNKAKKAAADAETDGLDALDAFMTSIKSGAMDTKTRMKLKLELLDLRKEQQRLEKLVNIAKPATLPSGPKSIGSVGVAPMIGKIRALSKGKIKGPTLPMRPSTTEVAAADDDEDEEEDADSTPVFEKPEFKKIKLFPVTQTIITTDCLSVTSPTSSSDKSMSQTNVDSKDSKMHSEPDSKSVKSNTEADKLTENILLTSKVKMIQERKELQIHEKIVDKEPQAETASHEKKLHQEDSQKNEDKKTSTEQALKRKKYPQAKSTAEMVKKLKDEAFSKTYSADDPDYSVWVPPTDQSGDGKTKLNEKFGY